MNVGEREHTGVRGGRRETSHPDAVKNRGEGGWGGRLPAEALGASAGRWVGGPGPRAPSGEALSYSFCPDKEQLRAWPPHRPRGGWSDAGPGATQHRRPVAAPWALNMRVSPDLLSI